MTTLKAEQAVAAPAPLSAPSSSAPSAGPRPVSELAPAALRRPRCTPLDGDPACLSLLSLNLLAPAFVRPIDTRTGEVQPYAAFEWAEPADEVLDWEARRPRLLALLQESKADVVCLQEVQFERQGDSFGLPAWLALDGYAAKIPGQSHLENMAERNKRVLENEVAIGCAVLYRTDRLEALPDDGISNTNTLVPVCVRGLPSSPLATLEPTVVFSVHLDAQSEEKRVEQFTKCLGIIRACGSREAIFAGDMNTECWDGSCLTAFLAKQAEPSEDAIIRECAAALRLSSSEGGDDDDEKAAPAAEVPLDGAPTAEQLAAWRALWARSAGSALAQRVALTRAPTGPTRAAFEHGQKSGPCATWRLDHIFYSARTLELRSLWETLEADPEGAAAGLPNRTLPSDHHPVAATFRPSPAPRLDAAAEEALMALLAALEGAQDAARSELQAELEAKAPAPEAEQATDGKKKKGGKEKPSPEMIAHIQETRKRTREQKEVHLQARQSFVEVLGELELDALERSMNLSTWLESGTRSLP